MCEANLSVVLSMKYTTTYCIWQIFNRIWWKHKVFLEENDKSWWILARFDIIFLNEHPGWKIYSAGRRSINIQCLITFTLTMMNRSMEKSSPSKPVRQLLILILFCIFIKQLMCQIMKILQKLHAHHYAIKRISGFRLRSLDAKIWRSNKVRQKFVTKYGCQLQMIEKCHSSMIIQK